jgi:predicted PurR-regulated permease PerM
MMSGPLNDHAESQSATVTRRATTQHGERWRNRLLAMVLALLVLYACALAKTLVVPVLLAILLSLLLAPGVRRLCRWYLPRPLAAFVVLGGTLALIGFGMMMLASPAQSFLEKAPRGVHRMEQAVKEWRRPMEEVSRRASQSIDRLASLASSDGARSSPEPEAETPGLVRRATAMLPAFLAGLAIIVFLTFLLLLYGDAILRKAASLMPRFQDRRRLVETTRHTQAQLSGYVLTITAINVGLGLVVAGTLALLGVEDPLLWGGMAALLNFAPYVGPLIGLVLLTLAGFAQFADPAQALLPPLAFLVIQTLEGQLVTPMILGRSMALDPVIVFLSLLLLGWLWGVIGLLLAVPLLTCLRICAEQVRGWYPLARLLGPATPLSQERQRKQLRSATRPRRPDTRRHGAVPRAPTPAAPAGPAAVGVADPAT